MSENKTGLELDQKNPSEASIVDYQQLLDTARQEARTRGDRLNDDPDRGFRVERLEGMQGHEPVPVDTVLPDLAERFAQEYVDGMLALAKVEDAWPEMVQGQPGFIVYFPVESSKYKEAVAEGRASTDLFDANGAALDMGSEVGVLDSLVDPDTKKATIKAYYEKQAKYIKRQYVDDLEGIKNADGSDARSELEQVSEAYELVDGGKTIRLINLSPYKLSEEQLRQATNAVRSISDRSGGELFDRLDTIAVVPEDYRSMQQDLKTPDGREVVAPVNGYQSPHLLALSDRLIKPPEERKPLPEGLTDFFTQRLLPGEPIEGPDSPARRVSKNEWEITLSHELTHIALHEEVQATASLSGPAPTLYGRYNQKEHIAELGAAEYAGGDSALAVPAQQRQEFEQMWRQQRGSKDNGATYKQPLGPRFVVCRELDITKPLPLRVRRNEALPVTVTYRLNPEA